MPLCLIQSLPGTIYSLTDALTVVLPNCPERELESVPSLCKKEVREGRASWHSDGIVPDCATDPFPYERLGGFCQQWRGQGLFSFLEVAFHGPIGDAEIACLNRLKQSADWLILDASSQMAMKPGSLQIERWEAQATLMKRIDKRVGLRISVDHSLPLSVLAPWIAKLALILGEPGFLFLEGRSAESVLVLVREIQNGLSSHTLSKGSARLIPVVHSTVHAIHQQSIELLDFSSLDALFIESCRPFFGGIAIYQRKGRSLFGQTLWSALLRMMTEKCSSSSLISETELLGSFASQEQRVLLVQKIYALLNHVVAKDQARILSSKADLEAFWAQISGELLFESNDFLEMKEVVKALVGQANDFLAQIGTTADRRRSTMNSFVSSLTV